MTINEFWGKFLVETNKDASTSYIEAFRFGLTEKRAQDFVSLVLSGQKKATVRSLPSYTLRNVYLPQTGDYYIVTDWGGKPYCVIEITAVTIIPFEDVTYDICQREGEYDSLESWQQHHRRFFMGEGKVMGYQFSEIMPIVFAAFNVIYQLS